MADNYYAKPLDHNQIAAICRDVATRNGVDTESLDSLIFDFAKRWGRTTDVSTIEDYFMRRLKEFTPPHIATKTE